MTEEEWRDIEGYPKYKISNLGRIKSFNRSSNGYILKSNSVGRGYQEIQLHNSGSSKQYIVHRLVAKAFIPNPNNYELVNHKNGVASDNRVINLEWRDSKYNNKYTHILHSEMQKGESNSATKLKNIDVLSIYKDIWNGKTTLKEIANNFNISIATVSSIKNGKNWASITGHKKKDPIPNIKLTEENVKEIYTNNSPYSKIAKTFNITVGQVCNIKHGKYWNKITHHKPQTLIVQPKINIEAVRNLPARLMPNDILFISKIAWIRNLIIYKNELWKDIKGYEELYQISNYGRVKSYKMNIYGSLRTPKQNQKGYLQINISDKNHVTKTYQIHRLVAYAFIPNTDNKPQINHIDGNIKNNCVSNLEWCDAKYNMKHKFILNPDVNSCICGEANGCSKLTAQEVSEIYNLAWSSKLTQAQIAEKYSISRSHVSTIKSGAVWKHVVTTEKLKIM